MVIDDILIKITSFLDINDFLNLNCINKKLSFVINILQNHLWKKFALIKFGFKYENYMIFMKKQNWRFLYAKANVFLKNITNGQPETKYFKSLLLRPFTVWYEGSLAMTPDCNRLLWENGVYLQCIDINNGIELFCTFVGGERNKNTKPCLVSTQTKIVLQLNKNILKFDLFSGEFLGFVEIHKNIYKENWLDEEASDFSLDVSIRNSQLTFLSAKTLYVFHSETLEFQYAIRHKEIVRPLLQVETDDIDFLWAGYRCIDPIWFDNNISLSKLDLNSPISNEKNKKKIKKNDNMSRHIVTWLRKKSHNIKIWNMINGKEIQILSGHKEPLLRVRQCQNLKDLRHYYLASLDVLGYVKVWDSNNDFVCITTLNLGSNQTYRLSFTTTHLMAMQEVRDTLGCIVKVWKFQPEHYKKKIILEKSKEIKNKNINDNLLINEKKKKI